MPPTVKSLEERIDDMAEDVLGIKKEMAAFGAKMDIVAAQLATVVNTLTSTHAQLAVVTARLDTVTDSLAATNARLENVANRLDTRIDSLAVKLETTNAEFAAFRASASVSLGIMKWIGAFAAGALLTIFVSAVSVIQTSGRVAEKVDQNRTLIEEIKTTLNTLKVAGK